MTAEKLGCGVEHQVGSPLERTEQVRRGECVVDQKRDAGLVSDLGDPRNIHDLEPGITQSLAVDELGVGLDRCPDLVRITR